MRQVVVAETDEEALAITRRPTGLVSFDHQVVA